jgi:hypothetical protein
MTNKKYSDSVWKEKLWGQMGEEMKNIGNYNHTDRNEEELTC